MDEVEFSEDILAELFGENCVTFDGFETDHDYEVISKDELIAISKIENSYVMIFKHQNQAYLVINYINKLTRNWKFSKVMKVFPKIIKNTIWEDLNNTIVWSEIE